MSGLPLVIPSGSCGECRSSYASKIVALKIKFSTPFQLTANRPVIRINQRMQMCRQDHQLSWSNKAVLTIFETPQEDVWDCTLLHDMCDMQVPSLTSSPCRLHISQNHSFGTTEIHNSATITIWFTTSLSASTTINTKARINTPPPHPRWNSFVVPWCPSIRALESLAAGSNVVFHGVVLLFCPKKEGCTLGSRVQKMDWKHGPAEDGLDTIGPHLPTAPNKNVAQCRHTGICFEDFFLILISKKKSVYLDKTNSKFFEISFIINAYIYKHTSAPHSSTTCRDASRFPAASIFLHKCSSLQSCWGWVAQTRFLAGIVKSQFCRQKSEVAPHHFLRYMLQYILPVINRRTKHIYNHSGRRHRYAVNLVNCIVRQARADGSTCPQWYYGGDQYNVDLFLSTSSDRSMAGISITMSDCRTSVFTGGHFSFCCMGILCTFFALEIGSTVEQMVFVPILTYIHIRKTSELTFALNDLLLRITNEARHPKACPTAHARPELAWLSAYKNPIALGSMSNIYSPSTSLSPTSVHKTLTPLSNSRMNFNASVLMALVLSLGAFLGSCMFLDTSMLVAANPLPHIIPDERKCHGVLNCNNANLGLGNLVNVGDIPIKAIIPMSVRLQFYVHYYFGNRCSPRIPLPLVSFTFLAETSCALRLVVRPESQQHFIHTCFSLYSAGCHSNGQPYQWAASQPLEACQSILVSVICASLTTSAPSNIFTLRDDDKFHVICTRETYRNFESGESAAPKVARLVLLVHWKSLTYSRGTHGCVRVIRGQGADEPRYIHPMSLISASALVTGTHIMLRDKHCRRGLRSVSKILLSSRLRAHDPGSQRAGLPGAHRQLPRSFIAHTITGARQLQSMACTHFAKYHPSTHLLIIHTDNSTRLRDSTASSHQDHPRYSESLTAVRYTFSLRVRNTLHKSLAGFPQIRNIYIFLVFPVCPKLGLL
ncbi:hypothetical protein VP01_1770g1 [Puccinia sorghi]|uniref:Uncharacterized protein n=1 Tax=Puccinia sorghi TaxID=27349 RepID=A0A0L6VGL8_9BASI|nr:hypothetical protein VP01_1770g1 [Puccinia sorghi]